MNQYDPETVNLRKRIYDWCKKREIVVQTVCGFVLEIKNAIIDTTVVSGHGSTSGETNFTSTDKLYLLAPKEIYTDWSNSYDTAKDLTRTLDYYTSIGVTTGNYSGVIKKNGTSDSEWWLRVADSTSTFGFLRVYGNGDWCASIANRSYGVSPAFRIG